MTKAQVLKKLIAIEQTGHAWFTRKSDDNFTVWVRRITVKNDCEQWGNAIKIQEFLLGHALDIQPDPQSGCLRIDVLKGRNQRKAKNYCEKCENSGRIYNNGDKISNQYMECECGRDPENCKEIDAAEKNR